MLLLVRRKLNDDQVADEIIQTIRGEKCICFCLTIANCEKIKNYLTKNNVKCAVFHSNMNNVLQRKTVQDFNEDGLQVICATKALGRGVHITCPVKFIIHTTMPTSLTGTSYITID